MDAGLPDAEEILYTNEKKYPTSSLVLFFKGRILRCKVSHYSLLKSHESKFSLFSFTFYLPFIIKQQKVFIKKIRPRLEVANFLFFFR